jgi:hypothetical protein
MAKKGKKALGIHVLRRTDPHELTGLAQWTRMALLFGEVGNCAGGRSRLYGTAERP